MYEKLEKILAERNITNYRISKDTGIPQSTLSQWKIKKKIPKFENVVKIADYLQVDVKELL